MTLSVHHHLQERRPLLTRAAAGDGKHHLYSCRFHDFHFDRCLNIEAAAKDLPQIKYKVLYPGAPGVAQSVKGLALDFGSGRNLMIRSLLGIFSPSPSPSPSLIVSLKINK